MQGAIVCVHTPGMSLDFIALSERETWSDKDCVTLFAMMRCHAVCKLPQCKSSLAGVAQVFTLVHFTKHPSGVSCGPLCCNQHSHLIMNKGTLDEQLFM